MFSSSSYKAQTSVTCQGSVSRDIFELTVCQERPLSYILIGTLYEILQAQAWKLLVLVWVRFPCWFMLEHRFASDWSPPVHHMFDS